MTYVYAESTAVVGPLALSAEPHTYDLCEQHARGLTAPRGWELVRAEGEFEAPPPPVDDLVALAEAVREAARPAPRDETARRAVRDETGRRVVRGDDGARRRSAAPGARRGHLRVLPP